MKVHPIEVESYRRMKARISFDGWQEPERSIVARMVHATADESFVLSALIGSVAAAAGIAALRAGAAVIVDAEMVRAGMPRIESRCYLAEVPVAPAGSTRSAAAVTLAAHDHPAGAIWVIGNAPTALVELIRLCEAGDVEPALVVGLPVGFVGASESKAALWASALQRTSITNVGERGGSAVAAAAVNALSRLAACS